MKIAYASPLPPARSGIADYSAGLLPHLAARADITLFSDTPGATSDLPLRPLDDYPGLRHTFDVTLYHMGNSELHSGIYRLLARYPGVVVLHDLFLHHFIAHTTAGQGDFAAYAGELGFALGEEGMRLANAIRAGRATNPLFEVPLNDRVVAASLGVIVHSENAAASIRAGHPATRLSVIPHFADASPAARSRRADLGLPDEAVLFSSMGQVTAAKHLPLILRAFGRLRAFVPDAHFLVAGEILPEVDLRAAIDELGLDEAVTVLDYIDSTSAFDDWTATGDVVLNLRHPTAGETSGAALRALATGRPLVVFDHGWYAELPDDAAVKVPPMNEEALLAAMLELARSPEQRAALGAAGRRYVAEVCHPDAVARAYLAFLERTLATVLA